MRPFTPGMKSSGLAGSLGLALACQGAWAYTPGSPMGEFGPNQLAISVFFDHNGVNLYEDPASALMNTAGLGVEYALWRYAQIGLFAGGTELDISVQDNRLDDTSAHSFNGDYSLTGGGNVKLATPRFAANALRLVGYGSAAWFQVEDPSSNLRRGFYLQGGASLQWAFPMGINVAIGGEYHAVDGEQKNTLDQVEPFGLNAATEFDAFRGLVGVEYTFPQKNRPFISLAFRPTGALSWDENMGLRGGSISVSFGVVTDLGKPAPGLQEDNGLGHIDE